MAHSKVLARKLANRLISENQKGRGWRVIAREDYSKIIKPGTLNRIAKSKGKWLPKSKPILIELGLEKPRPVRPPYMRDWGHLEKEERHNVIKTYLKYKENGK